MNRIYREIFNVLYNFFIPQLKTTELTRVGSQYKRKVDKAKTPYQRLLESKDLSIHKKEELRKKYEALNPITLRKELNAAMVRFNKQFKQNDELDEAS